MRIASQEGGIVERVPSRGGPRGKRRCCSRLMPWRKKPRNQASAQYEDLTKGLRASEMDALRAARASAAAALKAAELDFPQAEASQMASLQGHARSIPRHARSAAAALRSAEAQLETGASPAREDQVKAVKPRWIRPNGGSSATGPRAKAALVEDVYSARANSQPPASLVLLLPPENIKVRFFSGRKVGAARRRKVRFL